MRTCCLRPTPASASTSTASTSFILVKLVVSLCLSSGSWHEFLRVSIHARLCISLVFLLLLTFASFVFLAVLLGRAAAISQLEVNFLLRSLVLVLFQAESRVFRLLDICRVVAAIPIDLLL